MRPSLPVKCQQLSESEEAHRSLIIIMIAIYDEPLDGS